MYFKRFLGVGKYASNKAILGETGRTSLFVSSQLQTVKYWIKLLLMDSDRFLLHSYNVLKRLDDNGKYFPWVSDTRNILFMSGLSLAWISQDVGNEK